MSTVFTLIYKLHEIVINNDGSQLITTIHKNGVSVPGFNLPTSNQNLGQQPYLEDNFGGEIATGKQYIDAIISKDKKFLVTYRFYKDDVYVTDNYQYANDEMLADEEILKIIFAWRVNYLGDRSPIRINDQRELTTREVQQFGL
jgi:hypothetical protein